MSTKEQIKRDEVAEELTWDLTPIFKNDDDWEKAFLNSQKDIETFKEKYAGTIKSGQKLLEVLNALFELARKFENVYIYAHLKSDQDTANSKYSGFADRVSALAAKFSAAVAFFEPEINQIDEIELQSYFKDEPKLDEFAFYIKKITDSKAHVLDAAQEELLAKASDVLGSAEKTFSVLNNADLKFGDIEDENGDIVELTQGLYSIFLESENRELRRDAFEQIYFQYGKYKNTFASTLSSTIKKHNFSSSIRKFDSAKSAALFSNHIPESVFQTLVKTVNDNLGSLYRFVKIRKQILKLDDLQPYDLYTPIAGTIDFPMDYKTAKKTVFEALAPLGEDYANNLQRAFDERWIDVVENAGKRSGAYSSGVYDTNPYILLNWQDNLDNLYTLVHELGHSLHSLYSKTKQPIQYGDYPIFLAEIASTTNEALLTDYLLKKYTDKDIQIHIINQYLDGFKGTVFRQTQFAEFEDWMHQQDNLGKPLTADYLTEYYGELNSRYYGPDLTSNSDIALEWARIPHFYYNYYVYQYATGFAAAAALSQRIINNPEKNVELYLNYLSSGNSDYPIETMQKAGVDMSSDKYLKDAFELFNKRLDEFEELISK